MEDLEDEFMEFFSRLMATYGLGDLQIKVIGILYLEPKEISLEEISERTGYSLASISTTMKMLEAVGIAQRAKKPGTKKVFFSMEKDLAKLNMMKLMAVRTNIINPAKDVFPEMIERYRRKAKNGKSRDKLRLIEEYYSQMLCFDEMIEHWIGELEEMSAAYSRKR